MRGAHTHGRSRGIMRGAHTHGRSRGIMRGPHTHGRSRGIMRGAHTHSGSRELWEELIHAAGAGELWEKLILTAGAESYERSSYTQWELGIMWGVPTHICSRHYQVWRQEISNFHPVKLWPLGHSANCHCSIPLEWDTFSACRVLFQVSIFAPSPKVLTFWRCLLADTK